VVLGRSDAENPNLPKSEVVETSGFGVPATVEDWDSSAQFEWVPPERPCSLIGQYVGSADGYNDGDFSARFSCEDPEGKGGPAGGTYTGSIDFNFDKRRFLYERICRTFGKGQDARAIIKDKGFYPTFEDLGIKAGDKCLLEFTEFTRRNNSTGISLNMVHSPDTQSI